MKHIYYCCAITLTLMATACKQKESQKETPVPEVEVSVPTVDSVTLHKTYPGYIRANNSVDVVARVSGVLLNQFYKPGDYVSKGQVLFTIEPSKYRDAVNQAQAALATAQSQYDYASRQYQAMKKASLADAVSELEVIQAESQMNTAKAAIQNARAALATARENLGYCTVRASRSGHCTIATVAVGGFVNGGATPITLATIYDDSEVKAVFEIEDAQYQTMMHGDRAFERKLLKAIPLNFQQALPRTYTADLSYVSPNVQTSTGTIRIEGVLKNHDGELKDGMYVSVSLPFGTDREALLIKDASIGTDQLGKYVYLVNDSNKVVYTPIEIGETINDSLRIVTKGLTPKDRYVTKALLTVRNGEIVKPVVK